MELITGTTEFKLRLIEVDRKVAECPVRYINILSKPFDFTHLFCYISRSAWIRIHLEGESSIVSMVTSSVEIARTSCSSK